MFRKLPLLLPAGFVLMVLFLVFPLLAQGAQVLTNDGKTFKGTILEEQTDFIVMQLDEDQVQVKIGRDQIAHIQYVEEKEDFSREYPVFGATLSSPAGLNFVGGYYWNSFGVKVTGGYWDTRSSGIQANLSLKLNETKEFCGSLSLLGGVSNLILNHSHWTYGGLGLELIFHGFLFEADLVTPFDPNLFFIPVQIGYVLRFN